MLYLIIYNC